MVLIRLALVPFLLASYISNKLAVATFSLIFAFATDLLDGWLCRRYNIVASGPRERYMDSAVDFTLVISMFTAFVIRDLYPIWLPVFIALIYLQFVITSGLDRPLYDPVGKYLGIFFFGIIGVTILMPEYSGDLLLCILGVLVLSLASRAYFFVRR
jgi:CDP-diacylglycerol--glycerol-3-phosphate 3-phosphatidyltransferase/cardiolipin synthase